jgi:hypothetical protein
MRFGVLSFLLMSGAQNVAAQDSSWQAFDALLKDHVSASTIDGISLHVVDYVGVSRDKNYQLALRELQYYKLSSLRSREERLAFYINAYNLLAIKMVLDHWPVESIKDVGNWVSPVWPVWKKDAGKIAGKVVSLHEVEHEILRPMGDARIHMAIVCASLSCPDIRAEVYDAENLSAQLDDQVRLFLQNQGKGLQVTRQYRRVSKIFDWFEEDFQPYGGVDGFISRYVDRAVNLPIKANLEYNWKLNTKK